MQCKTNSKAYCRNDQWLQKGRSEKAGDWSVDVNSGPRCKMFATWIKIAETEIKQETN